ncbi:fumarylacetoacetate hydrolase family protein [Roseibium litorale]|uniref:Fumarylacetoacetate hydrolase family protein n=1 Tax=Roseibium litorale TaxID=2803841 RepID=A0ABR9CP42_9HYPH|nr:fumarylacetoacetate hydrolase family protein [Roseibium litorale]MBD8892195.1 fumarylacetoacetate hydrolase family protein [Roseibium litorale]
MKLSTVKIAGRVTWGVVEGETFWDTGAVLSGTYSGLKAAVANGLEGVAAAKDGAASFPLSEVEWLPVLPDPDKILCVGLNYETHRQETGRSVVENPTIFGRFANSQTGHMAPILRPKVSDMLDYEGELAIIIGKPGRYISSEDALSHVAGYSIYNDGSVRDYQWHTHQFTPGKNFPDTGAFGPWMMTPDELGDLSPLRIQTRLNGEVVQDSTFDMMIFDVARIIEYCSSFTRLEAGDVIATGTPGGVGAKRKPPLWMKPGDVVEVEIDKLGILRNPIGQES